MKTRFLTIMFSFYVLFGFSGKVYCWENRLTHPAITVQSAASPSSPSLIDDYITTVPLTFE